MNLSTRAKAALALAITGFLGGIAPLLMKIALKEFSSLQIVFVRFGLASIFITPLLIHHLKSIHFKKIALVVPAGLLFSGNIIFMVVGLQFTTSIVTQLFYLLTPVFVSLIGYFLFKDSVSSRRIISMIVCFSGSTLLILRSIDNSVLIHSIGTIKGNLIILAAVTCWSIYAVYSKRMSMKIEPTFFMVSNFLTVFIISALALALSKTSLLGTITMLFHSSFPVVASLVALSILNSVIFFFLYQWSLKRVSAFIVSSSAYLSPLSTAIFAIPFFGEQLSGVLLISAASIFIGSYLIITERK